MSNVGKSVEIGGWLGYIIDERSDGKVRIEYPGKHDRISDWIELEEGQIFP